MTTISRIALDAADPEAARTFYAALGVGERIEVRAAEAGSEGFRGYTLSLVASQPSTVDAYVRAATEAGAEMVKPPAKSLWGYGGAIQAPDGSVWTVATSAKKDTTEAALTFDELVLLLGVDDVKATKDFYAQHGLTIGKSFGRKYVEFDTSGIKLAVQSRRAVAKNAGVDPEGSGTHGIVVVNDAGTFTDPDGYAWQAA